MLLGTLAVAPAAALLMFVYLRDHYEPEPKRLVAYVFLVGALGILPAIALESALTALRPGAGLLYKTFLVAALVEEGLKWLGVRLSAYGKRQFNEPMDGIVYAAAASLGFATVENIFYVSAGGVGTGLTRALLAVPGHAFFGVVMGYHLGLAKFADRPARGRQQMFLSLALPVLLHGAYDALLLSGIPWLMWLVAPFVAALWLAALREIRLAEAGSPFRPPHWRFHGLFSRWQPRLVRPDAQHSLPSPSDEA
ncbi:MAG: PrsW family glutamic-type intramembrane protease [Symbiobacteriia bacterium]